MLNRDIVFQYNSYGFKCKLMLVEMIQSTSIIEKCINNGYMKRFSRILKYEKYYIDKYDTYEEFSDASD